MSIAPPASIAGETWPTWDCRMLPNIMGQPTGIIVFGSPYIHENFAHTLLFLFFLAAYAA